MNKLLALFVALFMMIAMVVAKPFNGKIAHPGLNFV